MVYFLLVVAAWGSLFFRLPTWLSILSSFVFLFLGAILLLFGLAGSYWDSHMTPGGDNPAASTLITGVLLLLSRAALVIKLILHALVAPPEP